MFPSKKPESESAEKSQIPDLGEFKDESGWPGRGAGAGEEVEVEEEEDLFVFNDTIERGGGGGGGGGASVHEHFGERFPQHPRRLSRFCVRFRALLRIREIHNCVEAQDHGLQMP